MNLEAYRNSDFEKDRTANIIGLLDGGGGRSALDVGARDGHFSRILSQYFDSVTAIDLERPTFEHHAIVCRQGDVTILEFEDENFDFVLCAEVLEHIPPWKLAQACRELARVSRDRILIGVPYRQDLRVGRTTCGSCGEKNPPWAHVNSFTEASLHALFPDMRVESVAYVGTGRPPTNAIAAWLMDLAGNPYGTYDQEEACIHCGAKLLPPPRRSMAQRLATRCSVLAQNLTAFRQAAGPNWIHVVYRKKAKT